MMSTVDTEAGALLSSCRRYRYLLTRRWGTGSCCLFVMLNPSTADAKDDDPTIRKCVGFAKRWGHNSIEVVNLYPWRATDPKELREQVRMWQRDLCPAASDPTGYPKNRDVITLACARADRIVVAWGAYSFAKDRAATVLSQIRALGHEPECLGLTKNGSPKHPLMPAYATPLERMP